MSRCFFVAKVVVLISIYCPLPFPHKVPHDCHAKRFADSRTQMVRRTLPNATATGRNKKFITANERKTPANV